MIEREKHPRGIEGTVSQDDAGLSWDPATYESISRHFQVRNAQKVLALYTFQEGEKVLDIGSGDGLVTAKLIASKVPFGHVVGIDNSASMLAHARSKYPVSNVSFIEGDACNLSVALTSAKDTPQHFDLIFSNATLHWLMENQTQSDSKHLSALQGMSRHLNPRGEVLLAFVGQGALEDLVAASLEVTRLPQWAPYFEGFRFPELYTAQRYSELLREAGLKPIQVEIVDRTMTLSSATELARWYQVSMRSFMEKLTNLGFDGQVDFASQAVQRYVGAGYKGEEVSVTYRDLVARAVKDA